MNFTLRRLLPLVFLPLALAGQTALAAPDGKAESKADKPTLHSSRAKEKEAKALLDVATAQVKKDAKAAIAAFNQPHGQYVRGELYVFAVNMGGVFLANAGEPHALVGMNTLDLRDATGKPFMRVMIDAARSRGKGSVDYIWLNRATNRIETKTTLFNRVGDIIVGVGYYTPRHPMEHADVLLDQAVATLEKEGIEKAAVLFNDAKGGFVKDDLYVFVVGAEDAKFYAHGTSPSLIGIDGRNLRDATGTPLIEEILTKAKEKGEGSEDYQWRNPASNKLEDKHTLFRKSGNYVVCVGYYSR